MQKLVYIPVCFFLWAMAACSKSHGSGGSPLSYAGSMSLSSPRSYLASAYTGNKAMFAGGIDYANNNALSSTVDLFDAGTGRWTVTQLSEPRCDMAGVAAGGRIFFAGGDSTAAFQFSNRVDIYDTATGSWTTAQLSLARTLLVAASAGSRIFFAGGLYDTGWYSNTVDIFDLTTGVWTTAQLSVARAGFAAAAAGSKVVFAGGENGPQCNTVDIYDTLSGTWSTAQLSEARGELSAAAADGKILFAGGLGVGGASTTVDIYDVATGTWSVAHLSKGRVDMAATAVGDEIIFAGGNVVDIPAGGSANVEDGEVTDTVDVYNARTNSWSVTRLSQAREMAVGATAGSKVLIAGGAIPIDPGNNSTPFQGSAVVDLFSVSGQ